ncbi:MAG: hypothetical protein AAFY57_10440 [Cyanobacteria bacterium J06642_2]
MTTVSSSSIAIRPKDLMNVVTRGDWIGMAIWTFRVYVNKTYLHRI